MLPYTAVKSPMLAVQITVILQTFSLVNLSQDLVMHIVGQLPLMIARSQDPKTWRITH